MRRIRTVDDDDQYSTGFSAESETTAVVAGVGCPDVVLNEFATQHVAVVVGWTLSDRVRRCRMTPVDRVVVQLVVGDVDRCPAMRFRLGPDDHLLDGGRSNRLLADQAQPVARLQVQLARCRINDPTYTRTPPYQSSQCVDGS